MSGPGKGKRGREMAIDFGWRLIQVETANGPHKFFVKAHDRKLAVPQKCGERIPAPAQDQSVAVGEE